MDRTNTLMRPEMTGDGPAAPVPSGRFRHRMLCVVVPLLIGLVTPSLVIHFLAVYVGGVAPLAAVGDILRRQLAPGDNLLLIAVLGLIPFACLSAVCYGAAARLSAIRLALLGIGGLVGILALMVPAHVSVWYPLYGPGRMSSTAVVAFLFIPFYCLVTLGIGLLAGWLVSLLAVFRRR